MKPKFYVYVYLDPRKKGNFNYKNYFFPFLPFYVGKGFGNRMYEHLKFKDNSNPYKNRILKKIYQTNMEPIIIKVKSNLFEHSAFNFEKALIKKIGRKNIGTGPLSNLTDGGLGSYGYYFSKEQRKKMGDSKKVLFIGKGNPFFGKKHTEKAKQKMKEKHIGKKLSTEHKAKIVKFLNHKKGEESTGYNKHGPLHPNSKKYLLISPTGEIFHITGTIDYSVKNFLKKRNISHRTLKRVFYDPTYQIKRGSAKGWKLLPDEN